jgi:hypothetical protein
MQSAALQVTNRFRMAVKLKLIKGRCLLQQLRCGSGTEFVFEVRHRLTERQIEEELDKADQVAAPATAVAIEQIFGGINVETAPTPINLGLAAQRTGFVIDSHGEASKFTVARGR